METLSPTSPASIHERRFLPVPSAPKTTSPVPWLTSIHSTVQRGPYGDSRYRGNCGGYLIKDLLNYFQPNRVFDPMTGSGTCRDVCRELGIPCVSRDIRNGFNAVDRHCYDGLKPFDFIWLHPPYWKMIRYNDDPGCLSNATTLSRFVRQLRSVLRNCRNVLAPDGKVAVLMGGFADHGRYIPLSHFTVQAAITERLWPACTEIIRLQHGNRSSRKSYHCSFIPGLHDICHVF